MKVLKRKKFHQLTEVKLDRLWYAIVTWFWKYVTWFTDSLPMQRRF